MKGHGSKIGAKREKAIVALLECPSIATAAQEVGISEPTIFRWLQDDDFQQAYRDAKRKVVEQAIARLQQTCGEAVDALREVIRDSQKPPSARVSAAKGILDLAFKAVEIEDLENRIKDLESYVAHMKKEKKP